MPEGPEARVISDKLQCVVGYHIVNVTADSRPKYNELTAYPLPLLITNIRSYGKKVILEMRMFNNQTIYLVTNLGQSGGWFHKERKHTKMRLDLRLHLGGGEVKNEGGNVRYHTIWFNDVRPMGRLKVMNQNELNSYLSKHGPDLMSAVLTFHISKELWLNRFRARQLSYTPICEALMDNAIFYGIGNYLRAEICYHAALNPARLIHTLTDDDLERLRTLTHHIMFTSYQYNGSTTQDYFDPNGEKGVYPLSVYRKDYDPNGYPVIPTTFAGKRNVYWCPTVQR